MKHNLRDTKGHFIKKKEPRGEGLHRFNARRRIQRHTNKNAITTYLDNAKMFCTVRNISLSLDLPESYVRRLCMELRKERKLVYMRGTSRRKGRWGV